MALLNHYLGAASHSSSEGGGENAVDTSTKKGKRSLIIISFMRLTILYIGTRRRLMKRPCMGSSGQGGSDDSQTDVPEQVTRVDDDDDDDRNKRKEKAKGRAREDDEGDEGDGWGSETIVSDDGEGPQIQFESGMGHDWFQKQREWYHLAEYLK